MSIGQAPSLLIEIALSALVGALLYALWRLVEQNETEGNLRMEQLRASRRLDAQRHVESMRQSGVRSSAWVVSGTADTKAKSERVRRPNLELVSDLRTVGLWIVAVGIVLAISSCGPVVQDFPTPEATAATATPLSTTSVGGIVWQDGCVNLSTDESPPVGCVLNEGLGGFIANGVLEPGESGISDVVVRLGVGSCPSIGLAETTTDADGRYAIEGIWPGAYCLSVDLGGSRKLASPVAGVWTYPDDGMRTVVVRSGEHQADLNFGWDDFNKPPRPTPEPSPTPACTYAAEFIQDVTIPDGSRISPGDSFRKTWRLRNSGSCTWSADYDLVFHSGARMGGYHALPLRGQVRPGEMTDLSVELTAPKSVGTYTGYWMLRSSDGALFGIGEDARTPFWVKVLIDPEISDWRGEYFDNRNLEGDPVLVRNDEEIDFNWKKGAPSSSLPADDFSARWTRRVKFEDAAYRFSIRMDDGVRLWVDDRMVIDEWEAGSVRTVSVVLDMTRGKHDLKLEYSERRGEARAQFDLDKVSIGSDGDWIAKYWFNRHLDSDWAWMATTNSIDFGWGSGSPALGIPKNGFSAQWRRSVDFEPGTYRLHARADDGIRVAIDDVLVIDEWHLSDGSSTYTAELELSGVHDVDVTYFEREGRAKVRFWWELVANAAPIAQDDAFEAVQAEPLEVAAPGVLANDTDDDGQGLVAVLEAGPSQGTLVLAQDGSFRYVPAPEFSGEDQFTYRASDGESASELATVTITVAPADLPPVATDDVYEVFEDGTLSVSAPGILENDLDPEGESLEILLEAEPVLGTLSLAEDGSFTYVPPADFHGEEQFSYRVSDGISVSELAIVRIVIVPVNDQPHAVEDSVSGMVDQVLEIPVLANDTGLGDGPLTLSVETPPNGGTVEVAEDRIFYTPRAGFSGKDLFEYVVSDLDGESSRASVFVSVIP